MLFLGNDRKRRAFRLSRQSGATVEQLQEQLEAMCSQRAFDCAEYEKQIALLLRDVARAEYKLAKAEAALALVLAPAASEMMH